MDGHRNVWRCRPAYVVIACIAAVSPLAAACSSGPERSVEAFCSVVRNGKAQILGQRTPDKPTTTDKDTTTDDTAYSALVPYDTATSHSALADSIALSLGGSTLATRRLYAYLSRLSMVAPDEVRADTEAIANVFAKQLKASGNPLRIFGAMLSAWTTWGPFVAVNEYAEANCGEGL